MSRSSGDAYPEQPPGSPSTGEPVFLIIGKLRRPHGVQGEFVMEVLTEFPERLERGLTVYVGADYNPLRLRSVRRQSDLLLVAFQGIHNPEQAGKYRNQFVFVRADQVPSLSEGEFYHHQIVGLKVISDTGIELGVVDSVLETGSNDVLVVHSEQGQDILLPFTDEVMLQIDLEGGLITVHLLPGLLP